MSPLILKIGQTIIQSQIKDKLVNYKLPKHWIKLPEIPKSPQGKINRTNLIKLAETFFDTESNPGRYLIVVILMVIYEVFLN
jgi:O-succinylbenzoic acid--CoA ligase